MSVGTKRSHCWQAYSHARQLIFIATTDPDLETDPAVNISLGASSLLVYSNTIDTNRPMVILTKLPYRQYIMLYNVYVIM